MAFDIAASATSVQLREADGRWMTRPAR